MGREVGTRISREFVATELVGDMISMPARYPKQDILHGIEIIEAVERIGAPAVPELSVAVDDEDETTRRWAARALGESGTAARPSIPVLVRCLGIESDATVRDVLVIAIGSIGVPLKHEEALINVFGRLLREGKLSSWRNGGWLYSVLGDRAVAYWVDSLSSGSFDQRRSAVYSLLQTNLTGDSTSYSKAREALPALRAVAKSDSDGQLRGTAQELVERIETWVPYPSAPETGE